MRKQLAIMGICVLSITLCFSGCEKIGMKSDHITVNIMAAVFVKIVDANNTIMNISVDGISVTIKMIKNGADQLAFERIVQNGLCQATGVFDLYKDQFIECNATVQSGYNNYYPVGPGSAMLTWETVNGSANSGNMYNWYPHIFLYMKNGSAI
jgi:hypothetical protein